MLIFLSFCQVTRFDLKKFPANPVWDGTAIYQKTEKEALLGAFSNFTNRLNHYPDSHVLLGWMYVPQVSNEIFSSTTLTHLDGRFVDSMMKDSINAHHMRITAYHDIHDQKNRVLSHTFEAEHVATSGSRVLDK